MLCKSYNKRYFLVEQSTLWCAPALSMYGLISINMTIVTIYCPFPLMSSPKIKIITVLTADNLKFGYLKLYYSQIVLFRDLYRRSFIIFIQIICFLCAPGLFICGSIGLYMMIFMFNNATP